MGTETPWFGAEYTQEDKMRELWETAGMDSVATRRFSTGLVFDDFEDFWNSNVGTPNTVSKAVDSLSENEVEQLKELLREQLPTDEQGKISYMAYANAVKGVVA
jgi:hypothetical protein